MKYFLGIKAIDIEGGVCLSKIKYILELLHEYGMLGYKPINVHLDPSQKINKDAMDKNDVLLVNVIEYHKLIKNLIYFTVTRPNISYIMQTLSQSIHSPRTYHMEVALRLLRYLKFSPGKDGSNS